MAARVKDSGDGVGGVEIQRGEGGKGGWGAGQRGKGGAGPGEKGGPSRIEE